MFSAFPEDALVRIKPDEIRKKGSVPTNGSIFFTIFQTFMSGQNDTPYFGDYPKDFFDLIIIDECHRGGANDGFLTPFKVRRIKTTMDDFVYTSDDRILEGEVEYGKIYTGADWNRIIEIKVKEEYNTKLLLKEINQNEKSIVFCATQDHALAIRDLINQYKKSTEPNYCARVTANDGKLGELYLAEFRDNEKTIPTILTTSQKLSTGVDARNIRNIILMRPINSMIEFKQIIGRGTRLFEEKEFFTIYDFFYAYTHFSDLEWDGPPITDVCANCDQNPCVCEKKPARLCTVCGKRPYECEKTPPKPCPKCNKSPCECPKKVKIKLVDGKEREIQHTMQTSFWSADGKPISTEEFLHSLYGKLPEFFKDEAQLPDILKIKYSAINDATELLGGVIRIRATFFDFQQHLFATA
jgi:type I restriction enzyme R subunit